MKISNTYVPGGFPDGYYGPTQTPLKSRSPTMTNPTEGPRVVRGFITAETVDAETGLNRTIYVGDRPLWEGDEPVFVLYRHSTGVGPVEGWMVEWLNSRSFDVLPQQLLSSLIGYTGPKPRDVEIEGWVDELIANAIAEILGEEK